LLFKIFEFGFIYSCPAAWRTSVANHTLWLALTHNTDNRRRYTVYHSMFKRRCCAVVQTIYLLSIHRHSACRWSLFYIASSSSTVDCFEERESYKVNPETPMGTVTKDLHNQCISFVTSSLSNKVMRINK
jgi:hypothetical protein